MTTRLMGQPKELEMGHRYNGKPLLTETQLSNKLRRRRFGLICKYGIIGGSPSQQPDLTGRPWFKPLPSPVPAADAALGTVIGWLSLLPFMRRLTRREQRWRQ